MRLALPEWVAYVVKMRGNQLFHWRLEMPFERIHYAESLRMPSHVVRMIPTVCKLHSRKCDEIVNGRRR